MKDILLYIWQLPQNLLGLLFLLFIKGEKKHTLNGIAFYYAKNFDGAISLGKYIISSSRYEKTIKHEYGHCIQSKMLGPLYLIVIGIPSITWAAMYGTIIKKKLNGYYRFYTEKWADKLGKVIRVTY